MIACCYCWYVYLGLLLPWWCGAHAVVSCCCSVRYSYLCFNIFSPFCLPIATILTFSKGWQPVDRSIAWTNSIYIELYPHTHTWKSLNPAFLFYCLILRLVHTADCRYKLKILSLDLCTSLMCCSPPVLAGVCVCVRACVLLVSA